MPERLPLWLMAAGLTVLAGSAAAATVPSAVSRKWATKSVAHFLETRDRVANPRPGAPTRVEIPAIGVSADITSLGLTPKGYVEVPTSWRDAGWYEGSVVPGAPGASVLLGHTSRTGSAVFNRLHELRPGDVVGVDRADAAVARFVVDRVVSYDKSRFPTLEVYGPSSTPVLRLVTCSRLVEGRFTDNLVVFAHLEDPS